MLGRVRRSKSSLVFAFGLVSTSVVAVPAWAQICGEKPAAAEPTPDAIAANDLALKLSEEGRYVEALALFQKAYDASPSYVILYNIGRMAALTNDPARAIGAYTCHVEEGGNDVTPERKAEVSAEIARLTQEVGHLRIEVDEPGATIEVDGVVVARSPTSKAIVANPGKHRVTVHGSRASSREVELQKGETQELTFTLKLIEPPPGEPPFRFPGAVVGSAWVLTGLVSISAAVTGSLALVGAADLEDDTYLGPNRAPSPNSDIAEKADRVHALGVATDALIAVGAISGAAAISFSVVNAVAGDAPEDKPQEKKASARLVLSPLGLAVVGSFQ
ncbi:MAG: PEGA domain-containing protein [Polyangiaceae bacterium]|nr:PEGA domain-containing protein [Polyangiaceae bacterium]